MATRPSFRWHWQDDNHLWIPYDDDSNALLEVVLQIGEQECVIRDMHYRCDIPERLQYPLKDLNESVRRIIRGTWFWQDARSRWNPYPEETAEILENSYSGSIFNVKIKNLNLGSIYVILEGKEGRGKQYISDSENHYQAVRRGYDGQSILKDDTDLHDIDIKPNLGEIEPSNNIRSSGRFSTPISNTLPSFRSEKTRDEPQYFDKSSNEDKLNLSPRAISSSSKNSSGNLIRRNNSSKLFEESMWPPKLNHNIWKEGNVLAKDLIGNFKKTRHLTLYAEFLGVATTKLKQIERIILKTIVSVSGLEMKAGLNIFNIRTHNKTFYFAMSSRREAELWTKTINYAMEYDRNNDMVSSNTRSESFSNIQSNTSMDSLDRGNALDSTKDLGSYENRDINNSGKNNDISNRYSGYLNQNMNNNNNNSNSNFSQIPNNFNANMQPNNFNTNIPSNNFNTNIPQNNFNTNIPPNNFNTNIPPNNFNTNIPPNNFNTNIPPNNFNTNIPPNSFNANMQPNSFNQNMQPNNFNANVQPNNFNANMRPNSFNTSMQPNNFNANMRPNSFNQNIQPNNFNSNMQPNSFSQNMQPNYNSNNFMDSNFGMNQRNFAGNNNNNNNINPAMTPNTNNNQMGMNTNNISPYGYPGYNSINNNNNNNKYPPF